MPNEDLESSTASAADEQLDQVAGLCTCGHGIISSGVASSSSALLSSTTDINGGHSRSQISNTSRLGSAKSDPSAAGAGKKHPSSWLSSSFVHLVSPRTSCRGATRVTASSRRGIVNTGSISNNYNTNNMDDGEDGPDFSFATSSSYDFLERHQHLLRLLNAAKGFVGGGDTNTNDLDDGVELCVDCVDRVAAALETDTRRLYAEVETYRDNITAAELRAKTLQQQLSTFMPSSTTKSPSPASDDYNSTPEGLSSPPPSAFAAAEEVYLQEIAMLEQEVQAREEELENLAALYEDHMHVSKQLDEEDEQIEHEQNALELESQSFDYRRQLLTTTLEEVQDEIDKLCIVPLPRALWDLQVDPRGLRYPLINQLRLAFQPKGDVQTNEIQVAWSQATQLLLLLGNLFEYPGQDWKVVPLADCAKLIYRKEIFNLSPGNTRSLLAWNALLDQVVKYAWSLSSVRSSSSFSSRQQRSSHSTKSNLSKTMSSSTSNEATVMSSTPPPFPSTPTSIGDTELARLDRTDHLGWSQVIHRMASNLSWLCDRASERAAMQVASMASCAV